MSTHPRPHSVDQPAKLSPEGWLFGTDRPIDARTPLGVVDDQGQVRGAIALAKAEQAHVSRQLGLLEGALHHSLAVEDIWIAPGQRREELLPALMYLAAREARIEARETLLLGLPENELSQALVTATALEPIEGTVSRAGLRPHAAEIARVAYRSDAACNGATHDFIRALVYDEVERTMSSWLERFFAGSWAQSILGKTITRGQYISSMSNIYQFVRHTTRIAARAVAHSHARDLRTHYLNHLRGEINHEILIERDLDHLGFDVDYLQHAHVPHPAMHRFIAIQESTIGYQQAPTLLLACPLVAEGMTANLHPDFIVNLREQIGSWGVEQPRKAMTFLESHVHTDGGDDGHWQMVLGAITKYVRDELTLQRFLLVMRSAMEGYEDGFEQSVAHYDIWAAKQAPG